MNFWFPKTSKLTKTITKTKTIIYRDEVAWNYNSATIAAQ